MTTVNLVAQLIPSNLDLNQLPHSEQRVVEYFLSGLDDNWCVVPAVPITVNGEDREIDVVLVSFDRGAVLVEVKGGLITVNDGEWFSYEKRIKNPATQVKNAKYALLRRLGKARNGTDRIHLRHLVALPDIIDFPSEGAGPDCPRDIILTRTELEDISSVIGGLLQESQADEELMKAFLKVLRPDVTDIQVNGRHVQGTVQRLSSASADRLGPVIGLDENKRVYLRGGAGTGKTFVAMRWFRRALQRGEATMYVCFNSPLADDTDTKIAEIIAGLESAGADVPRHLSGNFHRIVRRLMGPEAPPVPSSGTPEEEMQTYWNEILPAAFRDFAMGSDTRFDTIIIDEAQDFRSAWLEIIEMLLVDRAESRLYMMADSKQAIYASAWTPPKGVTTLELTHNVRNSGHIGAIVQHLGGAPLPRSVPPGPEVLLHTVRGMKEAVKAVRRSLEHATGDLSVPLSQIVILAPHRDVRDAIIEELAGDYRVVRWQDRDEESVVCETIHRTKGLERNAVIFVNMDEEPDSRLTYVGASRATAFLSVIGREALIDSVTVPVSD